MGKGILGPTIDVIPVSGGESVTLKDASNVPGVVCAVHGMDPEAAARELIKVMRHPTGVDVCTSCLDRLRDWRGSLKAQR